MKIDHAFIVGVGGTGSHLVEPLVRLLAYHENGTRRITLIDGDVYEEGNMERQLFDRQFLNQNKASAMAERLNFIEVNTVERYIDQAGFISVLDRYVPNVEETVLVITSVDNHRTRFDILNALESRPNVVVINPGNALASGHVMAWVKSDSEMRLVHPFDRYPDIRNPTDAIPGQEGCQAVAVSQPQLIIANAFAAVLTLNMVHSILNDIPIFDEVHFDGPRMRMVTSGQPVRLSEAPAVERLVESEPEPEEEEASEEGVNIFDNF